MTLKELNIFYHLANNPHVSQIAKEMNLSQSAISLAIKSLETKLGEKLFDRIGKKLILNEYGRLFKNETYTYFITLKDKENIFKQNQINGILKIVSSKTLGDFLIPQQIFKFLNLYPLVKIKNKIENSQMILKDILDGNYDIGFIENNLDDENIIKEKIGEDELIIVSSDKNLKNEYYIDELFTKKWILREKGSGTREVFLKHIGNLAKKIEIFMEFSDFEEIKTILRNNKNAITCISKNSVLNELENNELFEIKLKNISFKRDYFLIYHKNKYHSKLFIEFSNFIKKSFI